MSAVHGLDRDLPFETRLCSHGAYGICSHSTPLGPVSFKEESIHFNTKFERLAFLPKGRDVSYARAIPRATLEHSAL